MTSRFAPAIFATAVLVAASGMALGQEREGEHEMTGEITAINKETGEIEINTEPVPMTVHFPADAVADLNEGDTITVHLAFEREE